MEATMEGGSENIRRNYIEHPMVNTNSPPIRRTDKGRIYSRLPTTDGDPRAKCMAIKHLRPKYHTLMHMRMAYLVSALYTTILQPLLSKGLATRQCRHK
jgi:hypothetical protein